MRSLFESPCLAMSIVPRDYQGQDHDESFRLWDRGVRGTLTRAFTGAGKTLMACIKANTWLQRGGNHRVMVVSYERQLVAQFAQEVHDYLGIHPGIEMEDEAVSHDAIPPVTVVSRQSVLVHKPATDEQMMVLREMGVPERFSCTQVRASKYLKFLRAEGDLDVVVEDMERAMESPEHHNGKWSRIHKFDWRFNWLVIFDEAHRHTHKMPSVGHIVDWFDQNPNSRRTGLTATPKRGDGVSIGDKMFPEISLDYPLFALRRPCAVKDGWAVPYRQQYIEVAGVDFRNIAMDGNDFDDEDLARKLMGHQNGVSLDEQQKRKEEALAKLVLPLLEKVGDRKTLIFSPTVEMAKDVAGFINARVEAHCPCGKVCWYPRLLIGDGAKCECGEFIAAEMITKGELQARQLDGSSHPKQREAVYKGHQDGDFQFLSVCGLCREGYNDPDISCVAIFRPVSKKASSLAEQMKGRGCRPCRKIARELGKLTDAEARRKMIAESDKPDCLIIDLVGVTGLADCASTVEIYAEGLPDEVKERAEDLLADATEEDVDVEEVIAQAQKEVDEEREKARREREAAERRAREEAERRAKADARVQYTSHDIGHGSNVNPNDATEKQLNFIAFLGLKITRAIPTRKQAGRIISQLRLRIPVEEVARTNGLGEGQWEANGPSLGQVNLMRRLGVDPYRAKTSYDASLLIEAMKDPESLMKSLCEGISKARSGEELNAVGGDVALVKSMLRHDCLMNVVEAGQAKRQQLGRFQGSI